MSINWNPFIQMSGTGVICAGGVLVGEGAVMFLGKLWKTKNIQHEQVCKQGILEGATESCLTCFSYP